MPATVIVRWRRYGKPSLRDVVLGQRREHLARLRAGDVDRAERGGLVDDVHVVAPGVAPVDHQRLGLFGARGRDREVEGLVVDAADRAVVVDHAALVEQQAVAQAARLEVADVVRVEPLEERDDVGPGDEELAERADVDDADALAHRAVLASLDRLAAAVVLDALPLAGPQEAWRRARGACRAAPVRRSRWWRMRRRWPPRARSGRAGGRGGRRGRDARLGAGREALGERRAAGRGRCGPGRGPSSIVV